MLLEKYGAARSFGGPPLSSQALSVNLIEAIVNYRNLARTHLEKAQEELATNSDQHLKYAALELRMAMEALTYDRALAYKDEFPPSEYGTWQPRKVMSVLLEIDPTGDQNSSISVGLQEKQGVPASKMNHMGSEIVLSMSVLKDHYDALGNFLHMQSMKQINAGEIVNYSRLRVRLQEVAIYVELVLSSSIFNITLGNFAHMECIECKHLIRKRLPFGQREMVAKCYKCKATYDITCDDNGGVVWTAQQHELKCANNDCQQKIFIWHHELEVGRYWNCDGCKGENTITFAISHRKTLNKSQERTD